MLIKLNYCKWNKNISTQSKINKLNDKWKIINKYKVNLWGKFCY